MPLRWIGSVARHTSISVRQYITPDESPLVPATITDIHTQYTNQPTKTNPLIARTNYCSSLLPNQKTTAVDDTENVPYCHTSNTRPRPHWEVAMPRPRCDCTGPCDASTGNRRCRAFAGASRWDTPATRVRANHTGNKFVAPDTVAIRNVPTTHTVDTV